MSGLPSRPPRLLGRIGERVEDTEPAELMSQAPRPRRSPPPRSPPPRDRDRYRYSPDRRGPPPREWRDEPYRRPRSPPPDYHRRGEGRYASPDRRGDRDRLPPRDDRDYEARTDRRGRYDDHLDSGRRPGPSRRDYPRSPRPSQRSSSPPPSRAVYPPRSSSRDKYHRRSRSPPSRQEATPPRYRRGPSPPRGPPRNASRTPPPTLTPQSSSYTHGPPPRRRSPLPGPSKRPRSRSPSPRKRSPGPQRRAAPNSTVEGKGVYERKSPFVSRSRADSVAAKSKTHDAMDVDKPAVKSETTSPARRPNNPDAKPPPLRRPSYREPLGPRRDREHGRSPAQASPRREVVKAEAASPSLQSPIPLPSSEARNTNQKPIPSGPRGSKPIVKQETAAKTPEPEPLVKRRELQVAPGQKERDAITLKLSALQNSYQQLAVESLKSSWDLDIAMIEYESFKQKRLIAEEQLDRASRGLPLEELGNRTPDQV